MQEYCLNQMQVQLIVLASLLLQAFGFFNLSFGVLCCLQTLNLCRLLRWCALSRYFQRTPTKYNSVDNN